MTTTKMTIAGMHCASCKTLIEEVCTEMPGVNSCTVDFETGAAQVGHEASFDPSGLVNEIQGLGDYKVTII